LGNLFLILSILSGALGQVFFKLGAEKIDAVGLKYYLLLAKNVWIIAGFASYGISFILWMQVLRHFDISFARPLTSAGYILTYVLAVIFIGEELTVRRMAATLLITTGVLLMK